MAGGATICAVLLLEADGMAKTGGEASVRETNDGRITGRSRAPRGVDVEVDGSLRGTSKSMEEIKREGTLLGLSRNLKEST